MLSHGLCSIQYYNVYFLPLFLMTMIMTSTAVTTAMTMTATGTPTPAPITTDILLLLVAVSVDTYIVKNVIRAMELGHVYMLQFLSPYNYIVISFHESNKRMFAYCVQRTNFPGYSLVSLYQQLLHGCAYGSFLAGWV